MGEFIKGSGSNYNLTDKGLWVQAIKTVESVASQVRIPYAVAGSTAYLLMIKDQAKIQEVADLDILLMGPPQKRAEFSGIIKNNWPGEFPDLDLSDLVYVGMLAFNESAQATLSHKGKDFPVHPSVFAPHLVRWEGIEAPVLHPKTYLQFMNLPPSHTKKGRIPAAEEAISLWEQEGKQSPDLAAVIDFERYVRQNPFWAIRERLDRWEREGGKYNPLVLAKRIVRNNPAVANKIRRMVSK